MVSGWACQKHLAAPIDVHVYVGGEAGTPGVSPTIALANGPSEPAVAASCGTASVKHRFSITLPNNPTGKIYVYGEPTLILEQGALLAAAVSVDCRWLNDAWRLSCLGAGISTTGGVNKRLSGSGDFEVTGPPAVGAFKGHVDAVGELTGGTIPVRGWACLVGQGGSVDIHVYIGGTASLLHAPCPFCVHSAAPPSVRWGC